VTGGLLLLRASYDPPLGGMPDSGRSRKVREMLHASSPSSTAPRANSKRHGVHPCWAPPGWGAVVLVLLIAFSPVAALAQNQSGERKPDSSMMLWVMAASALLWLLVAVLTVFMTRREVERVHGDHERRMNTMEAKIEELHERADQIAEVARTDSARVQDKLMHEIGGLHEKINRVHLGLAGVETEVRVNGQTTAAIARKLNVIPS
jgi:membrane protein implicated in regulation of membrane protease activity